MNIHQLMLRAGAAAGFIATVIFASPNVDAKHTSGLKVGDPAPDFNLPDQNGKLRSLKEFADKKSVVLYFYPKDDMGVCKQEACLFRDDYQSFVSAGAEVIGISNDSVKSHKNFVQHRNLPFVLLSDDHGKVRKLYGVPKAVGGLMPGRVTFVIDPDGKIKLSFNSFLNAHEHVAEALGELKNIDRSQSAAPSQN